MGRFERQPPEFAGSPVITRAPAGGPSREARLEARLTTLEQELEREREERMRLAAELTHERRRPERVEPAPAAEPPEAPPQTNEKLELELKRAWAQIHALNARLGGRRRRWWSRG